MKGINLMKKHIAYAEWNGSVKEGNGKLTTGSKVLNSTSYSFKTRFENEAGTNPDELLAASHAGCFAMAFSLILGHSDFTLETANVKAEITMDPEKLAITGSHLTLEASVPNISNEKFQEIANAAKENCPISKALSIPITLSATLK